jgi:hypothetical protein
MVCQSLGVVVTERRDRALHSAPLDARRHLCGRGPAYLRPQAIRNHVAQSRLEGKQAGIAGLEIADLVVSPIGRSVAGRPPREDRAIVEAEFRRRKDVYVGAGLVILPKE